MWFDGMTSAETLGWSAIMLLIGIPAIVLLGMWAAFHLPFAAESERTPLGQEALGAPGHFREPADPSYVDELIRARGVARVLHRPDPAPALIDALPERSREVAPALIKNPYRVTLADLIEGSRYVVPVPATPALAALPAGRHRRELVAA